VKPVVTWYQEICNVGVERSAKDVIILVVVKYMGHS
jgi:hypothetical protein